MEAIPLTMIQPVKDFVLEFGKGKTFPKVLEVGSRDVNGSVKGLINWTKYIGLDLIDGENVDVIDDAENIPTHWPDETFDLVICTETLEHVKDPVSIVNKMRNVLKKGGWMLLTTPSIHHPEHGWPSDYYRFFENTYRDVFFEGYDDCHFETKAWDGNMMYPDAVLGYGRKPNISNNA